MIDVRQLCRAVGAALHVPDVERNALAKQTMREIEARRAEAAR